MNEEMQAAPVEPVETTQTTSADTAETQEVAAPEGEQKEPAADEAAKALEATKRRIDRLTADKYRTKAENEQLRAEREQLQQQIAALKGTPTEADTRHLTAQEIEALADQRAAEKLSAVQFNEKCNAIAKEGAKAFKGEWDQALKTVGEVAPLFDARQRPQPLMEAILDTDAPHKVLHFLGTNPEIAEELADMTPRQQVRRLAQLEIELNAKPAKQTSSAPRPLQPVKAAATSSEPDAKADPEAWIKWRNKQSRS
jgi:cell division protein FtsB